MNSWTWSRRASSCTATSVCSTPAVIDGGMAAVSLLAWISACKYLDHLPLYRIEQIAVRQGVPLARSTLAEWTDRIGLTLQPLTDRLAELCCNRHACMPTKPLCANSTIGSG